MNLRESGKLRRMERALDAAKALIEERGLDGFQIRTIAARAELSAPTLYNLFGSKAGVVMALMAREMDELSSALDVLDEPDGIAQSRAIVTLSIERFDQHAMLMRPLMAAVMKCVGYKTTHHVAQKAHALQCQALSDAQSNKQLSKEIPANLLAHQILTVWEYAGLRWAQGHIEKAEFESQALHAWSCLLLGFALGDTRERILEELQQQETSLDRMLASRYKSPRMLTNQ